MWEESVCKRECGRESVGEIAWESVCGRERVCVWRGEAGG